jgi:hypothetical protein
MDIKYPDFNDVPCQQLGVEYFYYIERDLQEGKSKKGKSLYLDLDAAKKACSMCPVREECLTWALHRERHGIWGGTSEKERQVIRRRLGITVVEPQYLK